MTKKRMRIPRKVVFPFGKYAYVMEISDQDFDEQIGNALAAWCDSEKTIYLRKSRTLKQRRADFAHEMGHFFIDWQEAILGSKHADVKG